jgi:hypothetical protein
MKYKKRYVLGEGYPWMHGLATEKHIKISLSRASMGTAFIALDWPEELWKPDLPKYRLILERINEKKESTDI